MPVPDPTRSAHEPNTWLVTNHLEGDFAGGVVDLRYRFVLSDNLISKSPDRALTRRAGFDAEPVATVL